MSDNDAKLLRGNNLTVRDNYFQPCSGTHWTDILICHLYIPEIFLIISGWKCLKCQVVKKEGIYFLLDISSYWFK